MTDMRAFVIRKSGGPEQLVLEEVARPVARDGWVLIRNRAFGLNRSEWFTRRGDSPSVVFPRVLGIECVGEVAAAPGSDLLPGMRVAAMMGVGGVFELEGDFLAEINAVVNLDGDELFTPETIETFIIGDDGKFLRNEDGSLQVGTVTIESGFKLALSGKLILLSALELEGSFEFAISLTRIQIIVNARLKLDPIGEIEASGAIRIDSDGLVFHASLTVDVGFGADIGLSFNVTAFAAVNTTASYFRWQYQ